MDTETQSGVHKIPTIEELAAVKVFPLIVQFKKDVIVSSSLLARYIHRSYNTLG
jgi:hypothetical protein